MESRRFYDSHGGLWSTCSPDLRPDPASGMHVEAFGPTGAAWRDDDPQTPYSVHEADGRIEVDEESGWRFLVDGK